MIYNRIPIALGGLTKVKGPAINYQYDQKQILILSGLELPDYYTVDFCNDGDQQTKPMVGTAEGVEIPDEFLLTGRPVKAYLVVTGEDDGAVETRYEITLPVNQRPVRTDITPTPAEQSTIDGLIEAMNQAVTDTEEAAEQAGQAVLHYPKVVNEYWYVWDVTEEDYVNTGVRAAGSGTGISDVYLNADYTLTIKFTDGTSYTTPSIRGEQGPQGVPGLKGDKGDKGDPGEVTQEEFDDLADDVSDLNSALTSLSAVTEIIDTASGAIASFPDGSGLPMRSLVAEINPVQDLHGQDAPYPAGGGWNLADPSAFTLNFVTESNGIYSASDGDTASSLVFKIQQYNGNSFISGTQVQTSAITSAQRIRLATTIDASATRLKFANNGATREFSVFIPIGSALIGETVTFSVDITDVTIGACKFKDIQLEKGNIQTPVYKPYSNICPISGWTGLTGQRTGFNVWDETWEIGDIDGAGQNRASPLRLRSAGYIPIKPNTQYFMRVDVTQTVTWLNLFFYDSEQNFISNYAPNKNTVFTTPQNAAFMRFIIPDSWGGATYTGGISINYPSTETAYHAYTGEAISVSFGRTVYGGSDEVVGGSLTSTMGMVDLGTLTWEYSVQYSRFETSSLAYVIKSGASARTLKMYCSEYACITDGRPLSNVPDASIYEGGNEVVYIHDSRYTNATAFKNAVTGVQLVYPLATPQTFTHSGQSVDTLVGQNNVFVDTGDVSVTYQASIKGYIDKVLVQ